jgi:hypothetical protein
VLVVCLSGNVILGKVFAIGVCRGYVDRSTNLILKYPTESMYSTGNMIGFNTSWKLRCGQSSDRLTVIRDTLGIRVKMLRHCFISMFISRHLTGDPEV